MASRGPFAVHLLAVLGYFAFIYGLRQTDPVGFIRFVWEDNYAETASFLAWVGGAILFWRGAAAQERPWGLRLAGLGAGLIALEEISWGQRFLGLETPSGWSEINFQEELNFHNLANPTDVYKIFEVLVFCFGVLLPLAGLFVKRLPEVFDGLGLPWIRPHLLPYFVGVWVGNLCCNHLGWSAEVGELLLAVAVLMLACDSLREGDLRLAAGALAVVLVVSVPLTRGAEPLAYTVFREGVKLRELGHAEQARKVFAYLNRRPETATWLSRFSEAQLAGDVDRLKALLAELEHSEHPHRLRFMSYVYSALGRKAEAKELRHQMMTRAQNLITNSKDARIRAQAFTDLSMALRALGQEKSSDPWRSAKEVGLEPYEVQGLRLMRRDDRRLLKWLGDL